MNVLTRIGLVVALAGCAYPKAMRQADALHAAGDDRAALAQYDRALAARPRSDDARAGRAAMVDGAIQMALTDGKSALAAGDADTALEQVAYVFELADNHPDAQALRIAVGDLLVGRASDALDREDWLNGYDLAVAARDRVSERPEVGELLARARAHFLALADQSSDAAAYRAALEALAVVSRREPGQTNDVSQRAGVVRDRWATDVVVRADAQYHAGHLGPALALRRRAIEIADRAADRSAADALAGSLRAEGILPVAVHWAGDANRTGPLSAMLRAALQPVEGLSGAAGGLEVHVTAPVANCSQGAATTVAEQPYVSGQREVNNPQYQALDGQLQQARVRLGNAQATAQQAWDVANQAATAYNQANAYAAPLLQQFGAAQQEQEAARANLDGARRLLADIDAETARLQNNGASDAALAAMMMTRGATAQRVIEAENRQVLADRTAVELAGVASQARQHLDQATSASSQANDASARTEQARRQAESDVGTLQAQLNATPATLWEDVIDLFRYEVQRFTRVCGGEATVVCGGAGIAGFTDRWVDSQQIQDDTHPAYPAYGVAGNPLAYAASDASLVVGFDERIGPAIARSLQRAIGEARSATLANGRAQLQRDQARGLGTLLAVSLAAPSAIDEPTRGLLLDHLRSTYELDDPDRVLR